MEEIAHRSGVHTFKIQGPRSNMAASMHSSFQRVTGRVHLHFCFVKGMLLQEAVSVNMRKGGIRKMKATWLKRRLYRNKKDW